MSSARVRIENLPDVTKGKLLALACDRSGIAGKEVGRIEVGGGNATLEVPAHLAEKVARALDGSEIDGRRVRARVLTAGGGGASAGNAPPESRPFDRLRWLLDREREAEWSRAEQDLANANAKELEERGLALLDLVVRDEGGGLLGRTIVTLEKRSGTLPPSRLGPGDVVRLSRRDPQDKENPTGVVLEKSPTRISVAFEDELPAFATSGPVRLDRVGDDVTFRRAREAVDEVERGTGRVAELRKVVFGERAPEVDAKPLRLEWIDPGLNEPQKKAVELALKARDLALVHGPPGTGKTTTVVEIIRQAVRRGERVLATAPSNNAVDNLLERLVAGNEKVVRLGHPARIAPGLREHALDALVEKTSSRQVARGLLKDAFALRSKLAKRRERGKGTDEDERREMRKLFEDARTQDEVAVRSVLDSAMVTLSTASGSGHELLRGRKFDLVVLDEASQATLPLALCALARGARWILAGDHKQLPPTVLSEEASRGGLSRTLFEDAISKYPDVGTLLSVQYRMHETIMTFPSEQLYEGKLVAHESCASRLLKDVPGIDASSEEASAPFTYWDTAGMGLEEELPPGGTSARNPGEAKLVAARVKALLGVGVAPGEVAVIAPYEAQVRLLRDLISESAVEVDTVDGFQGREKEVVLVSLVRSNERGEVGFLADVRRMNVALTRAKTRLEVVGDSATVSSHEFYAAFVESAQGLDAWRSGFEVGE